MTDVDRDELIQTLQTENQALRDENKALKKRLAFARGEPIEELIREWTAGKRHTYKHSHDVTTENGTLLEVKYSDVHTLESKVRRWNWDSILGENEKKEFDYLVLVGVKDPQYEYPDLPFVFFVVPRSDVDGIKGGGNCLALNTNLDIHRANNQKLILLKPYLVRSRNEFERFRRRTRPLAESSQ